MNKDPQQLHTSRRAFFSWALAASALAIGMPKRLMAGLPVDQQKKRSLPAGVPTDMTVYKDPSCGCCTEWIKHVEDAGFRATARDTADLNSVKSSMGVPAALYSCHTARIGSYVVEGHVPADLIVRMLREKKADIRGIAVPGMPIGSPGMEMGSRKDKYDVLAFDKAGKSRIYASR